MKSKKNTSAIVFLNGEIDHSFSCRYIKAYLDQCDIYCADGAWVKIAKEPYLASKTVAVIGDGDSLECATNVHFIHIADQETTDFEKVLAYLSQQGINEVFVFGAGGGEMDHYLSNLSVMLRMQGQLAMTMIDRYGQSFFIPKQWSAKVGVGSMVSVMPFPHASGISYQGLAYPLENATLAINTRTGVRNRAISDYISINYHEGQLLVFVAHECL